MTPEKISLKVGYAGQKLTLHLRLISLEEEARYTQRFVDIIEVGPVRYEKEYSIIVDSLAAWTIEAPELEINDKAEQIGEGTPSELVQLFFKGRTNEKERMANAAMVTFRNKMVPSVDFL